MTCWCIGPGWKVCKVHRPQPTIEESGQRILKEYKKTFDDLAGYDRL